MSYETLIHEMLDKLLGPDSSKITDSKWDREWCEKRYSVVEEYFKKVEEDTKEKLAGTLRKIVCPVAWELRMLREIKKL